MSQHFVEKRKPPQGLSSFTKIRLGWIKKHQVQFVKPGETSLTYLSPLSKGGDHLVVKIPLGMTTHYLIENRQPVGYDKMLPDSGILILEVNLMVSDADGPVRVKSAVSSPTFGQATYKLEASNRNLFVDKQNNISIIPLWKEKENLGVLVTTPDRSKAAINAALAIQKLIDQKSESENVMSESIAAFRKKDFEKSYDIAVGKRQ